MWEYIRQNSGENDFLAHTQFKYTRKYMKNGKWCYVYDTGITKTTTEGVKGHEQDKRMLDGVLADHYREMNSATRKKDSEDSFWNAVEIAQDRIRLKDAVAKGKEEHDRYMKKKSIENAKAADEAMAEKTKESEMHRSELAAKRKAASRESQNEYRRNQRVKKEGTYNRDLHTEPKHLTDEQKRRREAYYERR